MGRCTRSSLVFRFCSSKWNIQKFKLYQRIISYYLMIVSDSKNQLCPPDLHSFKNNRWKYYNNLNLKVIRYWYYAWTGVHLLFIYELPLHLSHLQYSDAEAVFRDFLNIRIQLYLCNTWIFFSVVWNEQFYCQNVINNVFKISIFLFKFHAVFGESSKCLAEPSRAPPTLVNKVLNSWVTRNN